ncbi:hypothetical protein BKA62DRAFT_771856 [Auriculariales sp. MPI-PUGE-AT-0066]|nr:hypothetical protein BKA62DRAFT_771856 [Auriculariales sp. MPI-PUGE-AT-0066]
MAQLRLDDPSPFIHYDETFRMATPYGDGAISFYSDGGTYHGTNTVNSAATITFNGTGITLYGAKRYNHGTVTFHDTAASVLSGELYLAGAYTVNLDGEDTVGQGHSGEPIFGFVMYNRQNLNNGPHTLKLSNTPTNATAKKSYWVDIDYVILTTEVADKSVNIDHSKFRYDPQDAWTTNNQVVGVPNDVSLHAVQKKDASATIFFTGSAIDLYGVVCPTCGSFSVNLDGMPQSSKPFKTATGAGEWTKTSQVFFSARNLDDSPHVLRITTLDDQPVALQEAVVFSALNGSGSLLVEGDDKTQQGGLPSSVIILIKRLRVFGWPGADAATVQSYSFDVVVLRIVFDIRD